MAEFSLISRVFHRINEAILIPLLAPFRRRKLRNADFTIISNNCWGGIVYEYFRIQKQSPTVGAYFYAEDYIKFVQNLRYYVSIPIEMISAVESKHCSLLKMKNQLDVPVGKLGDIEIVFLHYRDPKVAKDKWERRCKRINWDNLIFKFSYMGNCNDMIVQQFINLKSDKKIFFSSKPFDDKCVVLLPPSDGRQISNDTFYFKKYFDIYAFLNDGEIRHV